MINAYQLFEKNEVDKVYSQLEFSWINAILGHFSSLSHWQEVLATDLPCLNDFTILNLLHKGFTTIIRHFVPFGEYLY